MTKTLFLYLLVLIWAAIFVGSVFMAVNIDGPRNLDTGFKRLDFLVRGQAVALVFAVITALAGLFISAGNKRLKLVGMIPISLTTLLAGGAMFYAFINSN